MADHITPDADAALGVVTLEHVDPLWALAAAGTEVHPVVADVTRDEDRQRLLDVATWQELLQTP